MNNKENLIPQAHILTVEEQSEGGKKSGKIRREKASFKKAIQWLIDSNIKLKKGTIKEQFEKLGINISDMSTTQLATLGLWYGAVQGNSANFKLLMELNGELKEELYKEAEAIIKVTLVDDNTVKSEFFKCDA